MQQRDRQSYFNMFQKIQDQYEEQFPYPENPQLRPATLYSDLEPAFLSSASNFYSESQMRLCLVHIENAFDRKLKELFGINYKRIKSLKMLVFLFIGSGKFSK